MMLEDILQRALDSASCEGQIGDDEYDFAKNDLERLYRLEIELESIEMDNVRLREIVKSVEYNDLNIADSICPWCSVLSKRHHTAECVAFTPDGEVR